MSPYDADIRPAIAEAARKAGVRLVPGWFPAGIPLPAAVYYLLSAAPADYFANKPRAVRFSYYFEVRALDPEPLETAAKALCGALGELYEARRTQYDDAFDAERYVKRITFHFPVQLGG